MKKLHSLFIAAAALLSVIALPSQLGAATLTFNDALQLGIITPDLPASHQVDLLNALIALSPGGAQTLTIGTHENLVTRSANEFSPLDPAVAGITGGAGIDSLPLGSGYEYLYVRYGLPQGGVAVVWYVNGLTGDVSFPALFPNDAGQPTYGVSGSMLLTPGTSVPDGGLTIALLGAALSMIGLLHRRLS